jgi:hypothetical protein
MKIANDELAGEALTDFLRRAFGAAAAVCKPGARWYVFALLGQRCSRSASRSPSC